MILNEIIQYYESILQFSEDLNNIKESLMIQEHHAIINNDYTVFNESLKDGFKKVIDKIIDFINNMIDKIKEFARNIKTKIKGKAKKINSDNKKKHVVVIEKIDEAIHLDEKAIKNFTKYISPLNKEIYDSMKIVMNRDLDTFEEGRSIKLKELNDKIKKAKNELDTYQEEILKELKENIFNNKTKEITIDKYKQILAFLDRKSESFSKYILKISKELSKAAEKMKKIILNNISIFEGNGENKHRNYSKWMSSVNSLQESLAKYVTTIRGFETFMTIFYNRIVEVF